MTGKIFKSILLFGLAVLLSCAFLYFPMMYSSDRNHTYDTLQSEAAAISRGIALSGVSYLQTLQPADRVTWIAADGTVLFDSAEAPAQMPNYGTRPEVQQALSDGKSELTRNSESSRMTGNYYAERLPDGTVLRLCRMQPSVFSQGIVFLSPIVGIAALMLLLGAVLALRLAKQIVKPINAIDPENPDSSTYPELQPLIARLQEQNKTIHAQLRELSARQREFTAITENMREGFLLADDAGNILSGNHSALQLLGMASSAFPVSLSKNSCPEKIYEILQAALSGTREEVLFTMGDSTWQAVASPVLSGRRTGGAILLFMDVTEREQRESLRREFSANVSHELKTPLTSISGFAELMKEGLVPQEKMLEFSSDIYKESRRLMVLVEDILQLSRLDENSETFRTSCVDLFEICQRVTERLTPIAEKHQVALELHGEHATVEGVPQLLQELVYNLVDNAIKYNLPAGSVSVSLWKNGSILTLSVVDTGIGIPYSDQERVFERFYRVDKSHSKEVGGTGLGLSIVKHAVQYHNARLELKSEPGRGTAIAVIFGA